MKLINITPELVVIDVDKSVAFYVNLLGFKKTMGDSHFARLQAGTSELMIMLKSDFDLEAPTLNRPHHSGWSLIVIETDDIEKIYEKINSQVKIHRQLKSTSYGTREFTFEDPDGYLVQFTQRLEV
jgi:uncharacterized glyoxalase superfamily protein PhnB